MPSELKVNKLSPYTGTTLTLGDSGDTVSTDAVVQASQFVGGGLNAYRNLIINGNMQIAQRGTSFTGLGNGDNNTYTLDRFAFGEAGAPTGEGTISQDTDVPTGQGFANSLKVDITTAQTSLAVQDLLYLFQRLEGQNLQYLSYGTSLAKKLTLSFWVKSNVTTGNFSVNLYNPDPATARIVNLTYSISTTNTWEKKTFTIDGDTIAGNDFTNDNGISLWINWIFATGTNWTSGTGGTSWHDYENSPTGNWATGHTANLFSSTSNELFITGVQLEAGTSASDFEFLPYDVNLQRCQRYYQRIQGNASDQTAIGMGYADTTSGIRYYHHLFTTMRAEPSASENALVSLGRATLVAAISLDTTFDESINTIGLDIAADTGTPFTLYDVQLIRLNTNADAYLEFDAEL